MQHALSLGQAQIQAQTSPSKRPALVAGIGAALVASAITLVASLSGGAASPVTASDVASGSKVCQKTQRVLYVSTNTGSGTVRLREGNFLSGPIVLSGQRQAVVFPVARPDIAPVQEVLTIEGNSSNVVITSDFNPTPRVFSVTGVTAFPVTWVPVKSC